MSNKIEMSFNVDHTDFTRAGEASSNVKKSLRKLGIPSDTIRRVAIAMYEGEVNMVIHAKGGTATVTVESGVITIILADVGPGIPDIDMAMKEGFTTATDNIRSLGFGAGMGLPNMKKYTDTMEIESEVGVGTTVTMTVNFE